MKTCIVIGAGASLANGLYFRAKKMRDTLPPLDTTFFEVVDARKVRIGASLELYLEGVLNLDLTTSTCGSTEWRRSSATCSTTSASRRRAG
jgi:hypothetical protein